MKYQIFLSGKNMKKYNLSSAEYAHRMVMVKTVSVLFTKCQLFTIIVNIQHQSSELGLFDI